MTQDDVTEMVKKETGLESKKDKGNESGWQETECRRPNVERRDVRTGCERRQEESR